MSQVDASLVRLRLVLANQKETQRPETKKALFIFGISGFVGKRLAHFCLKELGSEFVEVSGTVRTPSKETVDHIEYVVNEDGSLPPAAVEALERATHVLSTVPTSTDLTLNDGIIERKAKTGTLTWAGYLSTTAAYGDRGGGMVNEDDEVAIEQLSPRGAERVRMEDKWLKTGAPVVIFRLPGIYGPGRGPLAKAREAANRLVNKQGQVFCRVHVDDIVQALVLSMRKPNPGRIYNVCDEEPAASHEVSAFAYQLLGRPCPPVVKYEDVEKELSPMMRSFYAECKRVSNDRIKLELGFWPIYPTFREGFKAQLEVEQDHFEPVPVSSASSKALVSQSSSTTERFTFSAIHNLQRLWVWMQFRFTAIWKTLKFWYLAKFVGLAVILIDNGSVRPQATLGMRRISEGLVKRMPGGIVVHPTSWRYADRIDKDLLEGKPAKLFTPTLENEKARCVVIVPLFLGPSAVISRDVPKLLSRSTQIIADPLVLVDSATAECEITRLLVNAVYRLNEGKPMTKSSKILLVDHGSPSKEVNRVRRALGARVRAALYPAKVVDCSMERREEAQYDFNEPTLENAFELGGFDRGDVLLLPAFLFAGNHAGPGGDIEQIVRRACQKHVALRVKTAGLLMDQVNDDLVMNLLEKRIRKALL